MVTGMPSSSQEPIRSTEAAAAELLCGATERLDVTKG